MREIAEHTGQLDDQPVFWRSAAGDGTPVLYLHGVPTSSDEWPAFLTATGGIAPDLPGFGRSGKRGDRAYTMEFYADFLERFLELAGVDRVRLVVHDWGGVGLLWAMRHPERVERLVVINTVPFLPGYRWHRWAKLWRLRFIGELAMGFTGPFVLRRGTRSSNATPGPMPAAWRKQVLEHLDEGTQRAILRLYRSSPETKLAAAGAGLGELRCPALVVWGDRDPYIPAGFADAYAEALGGETRTLHLADAGHWPWLDRPDLIDEIAAFLQTPGQ
ncbi:unannotated protein [freshwater metagenome]|uniref:Unannotated protein n=1 Tax=freshwater metagenome TaxID=449393 RepID=A0A6J7DW11_9ZZZZ|nr:alpha/beta fold hydrolase [Actinomycetota bacterium]